jgi:predicted HNH restriction endonuclease
LAGLVSFDVNQVDSMLVLADGISINKHDKFRNQGVFVTVYVPVGKQVKVKGDYFRRIYFNNMFNINDYDRDNDYYFDDESRWQSGVDYIMKEDGLYTLDGRKADGNNDREARRENRKKYNNGTTTYHYEASEDSLQRRKDSIDNRNQKRLDSIERRNEQIKDSMDRQFEKEKSKIENSNGSIQSTEPSVIGSVIMPGVSILPNI